MEQHPRGKHESETQRPLPGEDGYEVDESSPLARTVGFEFGHLDLRAPEGGSWGEWVITRGIAQAERDGRPVDNRTAHYIAAFLGSAANPALRNLAVTGAIDGPGMQEELVGYFFRQTDQVRAWIDRLAEYCTQREDRGPVENWRADIESEDRTEAQRLQRARLLTELDELFDEPAHDELAGVEELGWYGLKHHEERPGGWILHHQAADDARDVFETDSNAELIERWRDIAEEYLRTYRQLWPRAVWPDDDQASGRAQIRQTDAPDP